MASKAKPSDAPANGTTPFDQPAVPAPNPLATPTGPPPKKRFSDSMAAIIKIDRILGKLTPAEQGQVYLHFRNIFQPELSFQLPVPKQGA